MTRSIDKVEQKWGENYPPSECYVLHTPTPPEDLEVFRSCLKTADKESDLQRFFETRPQLLRNLFAGFRQTWVIPHQRLGGEHVTDFVVGQMSSEGFAWIAVELESPKSRIFTKSGDPTKELTHAIRQILDWRAWINNNQNYAARSRLEGGLGLRHITSSMMGLILIGRKHEVDPSTNGRRRQLKTDLNIMIHTYDTFFEDRDNWGSA